MKFTFLLISNMEVFDQRTYFETLKGRFDNIPKNRSRVVRIFLSSTFSGNYSN